jgi:hypothetical protein
MMRKTIKSSKTVKAKVLNEEVAAKPLVKGATFEFPVGCRFILGGRLNLVRRAYFSDNTDMRLIYCDGNEEIVMLSTLRNEAKEDREFTVTE